MHGDTLCTDDTGYQAFRAKVHTPWIQKLFLALPLFIRNRIAAKMRAGSKAANSSKSMTIMDGRPFAYHQRRTRSSRRAGCLAQRRLNG